MSRIFEIIEGRNLKKRTGTSDNDAVCKDDDDMCKVVSL